MHGTRHRLAVIPESPEIEKSLTDLEDQAF